MIGFFRGFFSFFQAFGFIWRNRLIAWYLAPLLLWLVLVAGLTFSIYELLETPLQQLLDTWFGTTETFGDKSIWQMLKAWLFEGLKLASAFVVHLLLLYALGRFMKYLILIITSPLLAWISEKSEEILTGNRYPFNLRRFLKEVLRGILITLRNLLIEGLLIGVAFLLTLFFPAWSLVFTVLLFAVNCYFMGFSMFDYVAERKGLGLKDGVRFMRQRRMELTGLGLAFNMVSLIPFADWVIAPLNGSVGAVLSLKRSGGL